MARQGSSRFTTFGSSPQASVGSLPRAGFGVRGPKLVNPGVVNIRQLNAPRLQQVNSGARVDPAAGAIARATTNAFVKVADTMIDNSEKADKLYHDNATHRLDNQLEEAYNAFITDKENYAKPENHSMENFQPVMDQLFASELGRPDARPHVIENVKERFEETYRHKLSMSAVDATDTRLVEQLTEWDKNTRSSMNQFIANNETKPIHLQEGLAFIVEDYDQKIAETENPIRKNDLEKMKDRAMNDYFENISNSIDSDDDLMLSEQKGEVLKNMAEVLREQGIPVDANFEQKMDRTLDDIEMKKVGEIAIKQKPAISSIFKTGDYTEFGQEENTLILKHMPEFAKEMWLAKGAFGAYSELTRKNEEAIVSGGTATPITMNSMLREMGEGLGETEVNILLRLEDSPQIKRYMKAVTQTINPTTIRKGLDADAVTGGFASYADQINTLTKNGQLDQAVTQVMTTAQDLGTDTQGLMQILGVEGRNSIIKLAEEVPYLANMLDRADLFQRKLDETAELLQSDPFYYQNKIEANKNIKTLSREGQALANPNVFSTPASFAGVIKDDMVRSAQMAEVYEQTGMVYNVNKVVSEDVAKAASGSLELMAQNNPPAFVKTAQSFQMEPGQSTLFYKQMIEHTPETSQLRRVYEMMGANPSVIDSPNFSRLVQAATTDISFTIDSLKTKGLLDEDVTSVDSLDPMINDKFFNNKELRGMAHTINTLFDGDEAKTIAKLQDLFQSAALLSMDARGSTIKDVGVAVDNVMAHVNQSNPATYLVSPVNGSVVTLPTADFEIVNDGILGLMFDGDYEIGTDGVARNKVTGGIVAPGDAEEIAETFAPAAISSMFGVDFLEDFDDPDDIGIRSTDLENVRDQEEFGLNSQTLLLADMIRNARGSNSIIARMWDRIALTVGGEGGDDKQSVIASQGYPRLPKDAEVQFSGNQQVLDDLGQTRGAVSEEFLNAAGAFGVVEAIMTGSYRITDTQDGPVLIPIANNLPYQTTIEGETFDLSIPAGGMFLTQDGKPFEIPLTPIMESMSRRSIGPIEGLIMDRENSPNVGFEAFFEAPL